MTNNILYKYDKYIDQLIDYINTDSNLKLVFNHFNQKYKLKDLFRATIYKLSSGVSYRYLEISNINIKYCSVYNFFKKIQKYDIFNKFNTYIVSKYVDNIGDHITSIYMDSTFIMNKYGIDNASFNPQINKHKTSKITLLVDNLKVPLYCKVTDSTPHDAKIFNDLLNDFTDTYPKLTNTPHTIYYVGDSAYDSSNISNKLNFLNLGQNISIKNKRNSKNNKNNLTKESSPHYRLLLKDRFIVEHLNNMCKQFKSVNIRYQKYTNSYTTFVNMAISIITYNRIYNNYSINNYN